jgi:hypothetical protein
LQELLGAHPILHFSRIRVKDLFKNEMCLLVDKMKHGGRAKSTDGNKGKGKGKFHPITGHEGPEGSRGIALLFP